jgi:hypothetical protein
VAMAQGASLYDPFRHRLVPVARGDLRPLAIGPGQGGRGDQAPVRLIFVVDVDRLVHSLGFQEPGLQDPGVQRAHACVDTGLIAAQAAWILRGRSGALARHKRAWHARARRPHP